jgi:hypothetical protein
MDGLSDGERRVIALAIELATMAFEDPAAFDRALREADDEGTLVLKARGLVSLIGILLATLSEEWDETPEAVMRRVALEVRATDGGPT